MSNMFVKDCVVLVTGANREKGIGRALVEEALKRGAAKVYATARDTTQLNDLVAKFPEKVIPLELDVTNSEHIKNAVDVAHDTQILINNSGTVAPAGCFYGYNEQNVRLEMEVNFFGPLNLIHAFSKHLIKNTPSAIVNIISIGGLYPAPEYTGYSASKAALYSLTKGLRIEMMMHSHPIPIFGVYPGPIETDMTQKMEVKKGTTATLALRVFDGMEQGRLDITTDPLSDHFTNFLKPDPELIKALKEEFD